MKKISLFILLIISFSCNNNSTISSVKDSMLLKYKDIPEERPTINPDPVKTYSETVNSFETTDQFKVALFETKQTFNYLIKIQYKQLDAEDTLRIPDFGMQPVVEIKKGDTRPSCIVGFLDKQQQFRESKLIYFQDDKLKIKVLKYYSISTSQDTIK